MPEHINPESAASDNARNNFLEQRGWHVLRFNTAQLSNDLPGCLRNVTALIDRCGGILTADDSVKPIATMRPDGTKQPWLF